MTHAPDCPLAALRTIRRAAHWSATFDELRTAAVVAGDAMATLATAWSDLRCALWAFEVTPTAQRWDVLCGAVRGLDGALGAFLGPSGWERPPDA